MKRVKRVQDLNIRIMRPHGIVGVGAIIPMCTASFRAGGLAPDHTRWISAPPGFFLPVKILSRVFRGKFVAGLRQLHRDGKLAFSGTLNHLSTSQAFAAFLRSLFRSDWVAYSKRPFGGAEHVLHYLGAYTHRIAISNHRLVALADGVVTFRWRDSAHKNKKRLTPLKVDEFLRRFLLHVLPRGFVRIRYFGFLAHRCRAALLPRCSELLAAVSRPTIVQVRQSHSVEAFSLGRCPLCQGPMIVVERLSVVEARFRSPPVETLPCP